VPTIEDLLHELAALQPLAPEHRAELASCARNCVFHADEWIMREGVTGPAWSPDSVQVAYVALRDGYFKLFTRPAPVPAAAPLPADKVEAVR